MMCVDFCILIPDCLFFCMGPIKPWSKVAALISGLPALPQNEAGELRAMAAMMAI